MMEGSFRVSPVFLWETEQGLVQKSNVGVRDPGTPFPLHVWMWQEAEAAGAGGW